MPQPQWMTTYIGVSERIAAFKKDHPEGSIQVTVENFDHEMGYVVLMAAAYRNPEDPRPGIGIAYEARDHKPTEIMKEGFVEAAGTHAIGKALEALGYEKKTESNGKEQTKEPKPAKDRQNRTISDLTELENQKWETDRLNKALEQFVALEAGDQFWAVLKRFRADSIGAVSVNAIENVRKALLDKFEEIKSQKAADQAAKD